MTFKAAQSSMIALYRTVAISALVLIIGAVLSYLSLLIFYSVNRSWAAPVVLGPTQERVLAYQPQIASLEAQIDKQKVEYASAIATKTVSDEQLKQVLALSEKVDQAISAEIASQKNIGESTSKLAKAKSADAGRAAATTSEARKLLKQIDQELGAKLITEDQAAQRRIALTAALNSVTDNRVVAMQLEMQARQATAGSETLSGGATSIAAVGVVKQAVELKTMIAQLQIQATTATATAEALKRAIENADRVLKVAKESPYYRALREEVTVSFVPYSNIDDVEVGDKVYDCYLQVILCRRVGKVVRIYDAEEHTRHPLFKTDLRGKLVEIKFTSEDSSKSQVVFIGGKPLLL